MSKNYTQLSPEQRYQIEALLQKEVKQKDIAAIVGVHPSTICRELRRNIPARGRGAKIYNALNAQRKTDNRHNIKPKRIRFEEEMKQRTRELLHKQKYSPAIISVLGRQEFGDFVSHETIYKWIWDCKASNRRDNLKDRKLYQYLAHGKRRRKRGLRKDSRGIIPNRKSIEMRPKIVEKRRRIGDIEVDLMMGKDHKGALLVILDRATLKAKLSLLSSKDSRKIQLEITRRLVFMKGLIKTITFDNDQAFSKHELIGKALNANTYFTRPYTSQDKGSVENRIGVIRRFFPKKTDLSMVDKKRVKEVEELINNRPVRKFNYKTPNQVFLEKIALIT